jgi:hypothetical protein
MPQKENNEQNERAACRIGKHLQTIYLIKGCGLKYTMISYISMPKIQIFN